MATNLKGAFFTVQKAVPLLSRGAAVVLNASINAHKGMPGSSVYGASKAAVVNLAKTLSADLLQRGVRVNVVSPGPIATPILDRMGLPEEQTRQTKEWITGQVPLSASATRMRSRRGPIPVLQRVRVRGGHGAGRRRRDDPALSPDAAARRSSKGEGNASESGQQAVWSVGAHHRRLVRYRSRIRTPDREQLTSLSGQKEKKHESVA